MAYSFNSVVHILQASLDTTLANIPYNDRVLSTIHIQFIDVSSPVQKEIYTLLH